MPPFHIPPFRIPPFRPWLGLEGPHAQTLGARHLRSRTLPPLALRRERWELPDGDFLDLDFAPSPAPASNPVAPTAPAEAAALGPLVLLLHGLEGSSTRGYIRGAMHELLARGMEPVALNFRSCSGTMNRLPRFYHSGDTADVRWVLNELRARFPHRALGALGYSLGGNVLLKGLGEGGGLPVDAAAAISVPFDLAAGTHRLESTVSGRFYSRYFLRSLLTKVEAKAALLRPLVDVDRVLGARTLRAFDDAATAPLHGFNGAADYYAQSSSAGFLCGIRTPTLLLHAEDDPFLPASAIPRQEAADNPWILPVLSPRGGHVGFVGKEERGMVFWAESVAAGYLAHKLSGHESVCAAPPAAPSFQN
jgi:uncharacterized protein